MKRNLFPRLYDPKPIDGNGNPQPPPATPPTPAPAPAPPEPDPEREPDPEPPKPEPVDPNAPRTVINRPPGEPEKPVEDPILDSIVKDYQKMSGATGEPDPEPKPIVPAPEPPEPPEPTPAPPAAPAAPPVTPPVPPAPGFGGSGKKVKKTVVTPAAEKVINPVPEPTPTPAPIIPPNKDEEADYIKTLPQDVQDELAEAAVAEELFPNRKGIRADMVKYLKKFDAETAKLAQANGGVIDTNSTEYLALENQRPKLSAHELRRVARHMGSQEAAARVKAEIDPELEELRIQQRRTELQPQYENFAKGDFAKGIRKLVIADDKSPLHSIIKLVEDGKGEEAAKLYPLESEIAAEEGQAAQRRVTQFLLLNNKAAKFNPEHGRLPTTDPRRQAHDDQIYLTQLVEDEGVRMEKEGGALKLRDGRQYMRRSAFMTMLRTNDAEAGTFDLNKWTTKNYWTDTNNAIVDIIANHAVKMSEFRIGQTLKHAERLGFQKRPLNPTPVPPTPPTPPKEIAPPITRGTPAPGPVEKPKKKEADKAEVTDLMRKNYPHLYPAGK